MEKKEAMKILKDFYDKSALFSIRTALDTVIPDLKEIEESEDERIRKELMQNLKERFGTRGSMGGNLDMPRVLAWLEKQCEQKPWSEEDEKLYKSALWHIKNSCGNGGKNSGEFEVYNWLKDLKERYTFKPSKEQIIALRWVLNNVPYNTHKEEISGLLDQIKDL